MKYVPNISCEWLSDEKKKKTKRPDDTIRTSYREELHRAGALLYW
jgi:hypothetical protein